MGHAVSARRSSPATGCPYTTSFALLCDCPPTLCSPGTPLVSDPLSPSLAASLCALPPPPPPLQVLPVRQRRQAADVRRPVHAQLPRGVSALCGCGLGGGGSSAVLHALHFTPTPRAASHPPASLRPPDPPALTPAAPTAATCCGCPPTSRRCSPRPCRTTPSSAQTAWRGCTRCGAGEWAQRMWSQDRMHSGDPPSLDLPSTHCQRIVPLPCTAMHPTPPFPPRCCSATRASVKAGRAAMDPRRRRLCPNA